MRRGTANGLPVAWVPINMENADFYQAQTDSFLSTNRVTICGNDYTAAAGSRYAVRNLFAPPTGSNPDPRPVFVAINCVSNSVSHSYREVLVNEFYAGGGQQDFSARITAWRNIIDSVQAPRPLISDVRLTPTAFEFTIPGQRGRNNRVERTSNFVDWITVTNVTGTNAPVVVRDPDALVAPHHFYRIFRP